MLYCQPDFSPAAGIANSLSNSQEQRRTQVDFFGAVHNQDSFFCIYNSYLYTLQTVKGNVKEGAAELASRLWHARHARHDPGSMRHPTRQAMPRSQRLHSPRHEQDARRGHVTTTRSGGYDPPSRAQHYATRT